MLPRFRQPGMTVMRDDGQRMLSAGQTDLLDDSLRNVSGGSWDALGFRLVEWFELPPVSGGPRGGRGRNGPAWKRQTAPNVSDQVASESPFSSDGGQLAVVLVLDRTGTDARCQRAAWLRTSVVAAGILVLICVSLAWRLAVRAASRARLLEAEARHLSGRGTASAVETAVRKGKPGQRS